MASRCCMFAAHVHVVPQVIVPSICWLMDRCMAPEPCHDCGAQVYKTGRTPADLDRWLERNSDARVWSAHVYTNSCSGAELRIPIEPLVRWCDSERDSGEEAAGR